MNIYRVKFHHYSPKDSATGTLCFVQAEDEFDLVKILEPHIFEDARDSFESEKEDKGLEDFKTFEDMMIHFGGDDDECITSFTDLYYGLTTYSWKHEPDLLESDFESFKKAGLTDPSVTLYMH